MPFNYYPFMSAFDQKENPLYTDPAEILLSQNQTDYQKDIADVGNPMAKKPLDKVYGNIETGDIDDLVMYQENKADLAEATKNANNSFKDKAMGALGDVTQLGFQTVANFNNVAQTSKERTAQTLQGAAQGAQVGMAVGGPIGAGVGAAVMTGINLLDNKRDKEKVIQEGIAENEQKFQDTKKERAMAYGQAQMKTDNERRMLGFSSNFKMS